NADTTYVLTVTAGTSTDISQVSVKAVQASVGNFTATSSNVNAGAAPQLTPNFAPATATVTISDGSGSPCGTSFTSGTAVNCNAINANTVYTLRVQVGSTVATKTATVNVNAATVVDFTGPATVNAGATPSLTPTWTPTSGSPVASVTISDGSGTNPCPLF